MNPTDAEIAEKLDGMTAGGIKITKQKDEGWIKVSYGKWMEAPTPNFVALCRAVVERVDRPATACEVFDAAIKRTANRFSVIGSLT